MKINILTQDAERMTLRNTLEAAGCDVVGIDGERNGLQVHVQRGAFVRVLQCAAQLGGTLGHSFYFPIGGSHVPDEYRHDGSYPGSRGFTLHALFTFPRD